MNKREREIEQCFLLYDYPKKNRIENSKLIELMNALGQNASENELLQLQRKADPEGEGSFTLQGFKAVMNEFSTTSYTKNDLLNAFELLDRDGDKYLSKADLKAASGLLLGKPLDDDKIDFMFQSLKVGNNQISYDQFEKLLK